MIADFLYKFTVAELGRLLRGYQTVHEFVRLRSTSAQKDCPFLVGVNDVISYEVVVHPFYVRAPFFLPLVELVQPAVRGHCSVYPRRQFVVPYTKVLVNSGYLKNSNNSTPVLQYTSTCTATRTMHNTTLHKTTSALRYPLGGQLTLQN